MTSVRICENLRSLGVALSIFALSATTRAQTIMPTPALSPSASPEEETIIPTFETQKLARTYILDVPAPRGQITDRNGVPFAQNRLSYNLVVNFPTPLDFSDAQTLSFTREKIGNASDLIGRKLRISDDAILRHYRNRGIMPLEIAQNLSQQEYEKIKDQLPAGVTLRPVYVRIYPNGKVAGQIIGYTGKTGRNPDGIVDNHETLWPETEGREGLEQTFNGMLTGKHGEYKLTFDKDGRKTSDKLITPPEPGYNVVTTLDLHLQQLAEKALEAKAKRGAMVIVDPNNGDILALASWPTYDPNLFVPSISAEQLKALQDDPDIPLLPRAYRSSYPPGSTFKIAVGIAALESHAVYPEDQYECVPAIQIGNVTFQGGKTGLWREVRNPVAWRGGGPHSERPIHEGDARPQTAQWRYCEHVDRPGRHPGYSATNGSSDGDHRQRGHVLPDTTRSTGADIRWSNCDRVPGARQTHTRPFIRDPRPTAHRNDRCCEWRGRHRAPGQP